MPFFKIEEREDHLRPFYHEGEEDGKSGVCRYNEPLENQFEDYIYLIGWREGWKHNPDRHHNTYYEVGHQHGLTEVDYNNAESFCPTRCDLLAYQLGYIHGQRELKDNEDRSNRPFRFWKKEKSKKRLTG
jgi:hypothetical protein